MGKANRWRFQQIPCNGKPKSSQEFNINIKPWFSTSKHTRQREF
jgi:hypothetical protein